MLLLCLGVVVILQFNWLSKSNLFLKTFDAGMSLLCVHVPDLLLLLGRVAQTQRDCTQTICLHLLQLVARGIMDTGTRSIDLNL